MDLECKLGVRGVKVIRNDRSGRSDIQPSQRNKVLDVAKALGDEPFVLLHNDVRPARGWLDRLMQDLQWAEKHWGYASSAVTPCMIPFHRLDNPRPVWEKLRPEKALAHNPLMGFFPSAQDNILHDHHQMATWCAKHKYKMTDGVVQCPPWAPPTDDGQVLMMFITRPSFFDVVGLCDEAFIGSNHDDNEWALRALWANKRLLTSRSGLLGHLGSLSFKAAPPLTEGNADVFIRKWGLDVFLEMTSGRIFDTLHKAQNKLPEGSR